MARTGVFAPRDEGVVVDEIKAGRPRKHDEPKPIAPYDSDPTKALSKVFDRVTGDSVGPAQLKTYTEVLAQLPIQDRLANGVGFLYSFVG